MTLEEDQDVRLLAEHEFTCSICSQLAGTVSLKMKGHKPSMHVSSFTGRVVSQVSPDAVELLNTALVKGNVRSLYMSDLEFAPFYCPRCNANYCREHWRTWDVDDEDGWYDSTRGVCPSGHERMLSD